MGVVTPWNDPLLMAAWKIAPILAAGNALVIKPSELTPLSMMNFAELVADLLPAGVLNVVTGIGPVVVSEAHFDRVVGYLERAKKAGVRAVLGRSPLPGPGFFVAPTVLVDVTEDHEVSREEIFGPVVTVETFTDEAEAVRRANGVPYGLSASVWTENARRSHHVASQLRAGTVSVNSHLILATEAPWAASRAPATDATCQSTH